MIHVYRPMPKQVAFHEACRAKRFVLFVAGRQSGKTTAAAHQIVEEVVANRQPRVGWVVSPTYQMSEVIERDVLNSLGPAVSRSRFSVGRRSFSFRNGFRLEFRTGDDPDRLRGDRLSFVCLEEAAQMRREVFEVVQPSLMAYKGKLFAITTPRGRDWVYELLYLPTKPESPSFDPEFAVVHSCSDENYNLPENEVAKLRRRFAPDVAEQEIEAKFVDFSGLVYGSFDVAKHVVSPISPSDENISSVVSGIDFGFNAPFVCLWLARMGDRWVAVDEYYVAGHSIDHHAPFILANPWQKRVSNSVADSHGLEEIASLRRCGVFCSPCRKHPIQLGINEINRLLSHSLPDGKPALLVTTGCANLIREFKSYRYPETTPTRDDQEKPYNKDDHALDALRYAVYSQEWSTALVKSPAVKEIPGPGTYGWYKRSFAPSPSLTLNKRAS